MRQGHCLCDKGVVVEIALLLSNQRCRFKSGTVIYETRVSYLREARRC
jgi:hypothetical protein